MSSPWFFAEHIAADGELVVLAADEARHATAARRLALGDTLTLFDGRGGLAQAAIAGLPTRGRGLELRVQSRIQAPVPARYLHVAAALPKGDRAATLLDMATQLGMTAFTPLLCTHSVVVPTRADRWQRICIEACKQSRRAYLPRLHEPASPLAAIQAFMSAPAANGAVCALYAHPSGRALAAADSGARRCLLLIGPEGGFSDDEVAAMTAAGAARIDLGAGILRVETAAVALLAALSLPRTGGESP